MSDRLEIRFFLASETGRRQRNEDYAGLYLGSATERARHGIVAIVADGVGGAKGGRVAAELAVRGFIDGYYGLPETLGVQQAAGQALTAVNGWIHAQGKTAPELEGMATTFTALILRGRRAHAVHVGDSRLYRLSGSRLDFLTEDHVPRRPDLAHVLLRAVGAEEWVRADYAPHEVRPDDRFLLCSDGLHGALPDSRIGELLARRAGPEQTARELVAEALAAGSQDNVTALVVDVVALPSGSAAEFELAIAELPIAEPPRAGDVVDGFRLDALLSDGRYSRLFRATDLAAAADARPLVLKFPKPSVAAERTYRLAFVREAWIAARVRSPWLAELVEVLPPERRTRLYSAFPFYAGETLEQRIAHAPPVSLREGIGIAVRLAKAVAALHRAGIVHRDVKPDNVLLEQDRGGGAGLRLLDLGVARLPRLEDFPAPDIPGTPSYMAPELFAGQAGDELSDQFALGVTIYRTFAGAYPYGEIEPFTRPRFNRATPLLRRRPDLPPWLDAALARATAVDPGDRFGDVLELALELDAGLARRGGGRRPGRRPLYERNPLRFWQATSLLLVAALLLALCLR
jgi:serine/threonine protein phosphatase PrpC